MKKIFILISFIAISFGTFATTTPASNKPLKKKPEPDKKMLIQKESLAKLYSTVTMQLSCCTVTLSGAEGDKATALILQGYAAALVSAFDWFAGQGGFQQLNPTPEEGYA